VKKSRNRGNRIAQAQRLAIENIAAFIGIDWSDQKHDLAIQVVGQDGFELDQIEHSPEAIHQFVMKLYQRFGDRQIAICLELSKGPLMHALLKYDRLVLCPINPKQFARYREAINPSGAKDDPTDAELILDFIVNHPDRVRVLKPDHQDIRLIAQLAESRRQLVDQRTADANSLKTHLKAYFPLVLKLFGDLTTPMVAAFLKKYSTRSNELSRKRYASSFTHSIADPKTNCKNAWN
jgi:transposase